MRFTQACRGTRERNDRECELLRPITDKTDKSPQKVISQNHLAESSRITEYSGLNMNKHLRDYK